MASERRPRPLAFRRVVEQRRGELVALGRRSQQVLVLAAVTGVVTGLAVALFEWVTRDVIFDAVTELPTPVRLFAPLVGLVLAAAALRWVGGGASPATADEYIQNFHERDRRLSERPVVGRLLASVATLGSGGALGYEGPSIYLGSALGSGLQRRLSRFFGREDAKVLLVAGAAAGVSAIFRAPATGVVFALEVPYQDDLARRMLLPASIASAASYLTFVFLLGTEPLLPVRGAPPFNIPDLGGAVLVGILAGMGARALAAVLRYAKARRLPTHAAVQPVAAGLTLAALGAIAYVIYEEPLTLGAGYETLRWALDPTRSVLAVVVLLLLRAAATAVTLAGGGAGGLFVPLVVVGGLLGRAVGGVLELEGSTLFPLIGVAAFLGAGYRTPLAAVMFVAESTGRPGFVVPGLIAAVVAQLFMGRSSVSPYQVAGRMGHLERRFSLPVSVALVTDVRTVPPDSSVEEFFWQHVLGNRTRAAPVVDGNTFVGVVRMDELDGVAQEEWQERRVRELMRTDLPVGLPTWTLRDAVAAMERADVDMLPIVDARGGFIGVVTTDEILALDEILGEAEGEAP